MAVVSARTALSNVKVGEHLKADTVNSIIGALLELQGGRPADERFELLFAKTTTGGIPPEDKANVYYRSPTTTGWEDTTDEIEAWNEHETNPVGEFKKVILAPINGRWVVIVEFC